MKEERYVLALKTVMKAGQYMEKRFKNVDSGVIASHLKGPLDLVSEVDKESERIIVSLIRRHFPYDGILSEESKEEKGESPFRWVIDPLEGTHNFLNGLRDWGCGLALENTERNVIVFGICYFPEWNEVFTAKKGEGAFCNGKKIRVSPAQKLKSQIFYCDSAFRFAPEKILRDIKQFCEAGCRLRSTGSFQFNMTRLAKGQAGAVTNRAVKAWDLAAPALIVEEAGGLVTDEKGNPYHMGSVNVLATNGLAHVEALRSFQ